MDTPDTRPSRPCSASRTVMTQLVFPSDTNHHGTMFGGKVMEYIDKVAAIAGMRHARTEIVTAASDGLDFLAPIRMGDVIQLEAYVTWTGRSSMEVYVKVEAENLKTGRRTTAVTAFLTVVALDDEGLPSEVPRILPETPEERRHHRSAPERHAARLKRKQEREARP